MTTYDGLAPSAFADLVEYCYGGANTTWGATRISDGHPQPYEIRYFEVSCKDFDGACFLCCMFRELSNLAMGSMLTSVGVVSLGMSSTTHNFQSRLRRWRPRPSSSAAAASSTT